MWGIQVQHGVELLPDTLHYLPQVVQAVYLHRPPGPAGLWLTSAYRSADPKSLHADGLAWDFDVSHAISASSGRIWAARVQAELGMSYDVLWHRPRGGAYHLHVEHEGRKHRVRFTPGQRARLALLEGFTVV